MNDIIKVLPDAIVNKIAAGEVVQRPASVVKELLENAIDARSKNITLIVKDAGKTLIQVVDDGQGMSETDARLCFERHATSKIESAEDLFKIRTMGFRGEAIASIASVSQTELKTRRESDELGVLIRNEGGEFKKQEAIAMNPGTSVLVKNLFYNIPARRNFLKSNPVEMKHIVDEFQRVALANPEIAFNFFQNDLEVFNLKPSKLAVRIIQIFGKQYKENLVPCEERTDLLEIMGYLGSPESAKKTRGEQYFFINKRYVRSNYLQHAVKMAYQDLISDDSFPFHVIFIEIDPSHIDVNVHPTKNEIKFDDERTVYGIIQAAAKKSLGSHSFAPSLDFSKKVNLDEFSDEAKNFRFAFQKGEMVEGRNRESQYGSFQGNRNIENWQKLYTDFGEKNESDDGTSITIQSSLNRDSSKNLPSEEKIEEKAVFQIHNAYIITQIKSGFVIIEQSNAHERILYEKYLDQLDTQKGSSQQFIFSKTLHLSAADFQLVSDLEKEIKSLGFDFQSMGENAIVINGLPANLKAEDEKELFEGLIEQYKNNTKNLKINKKENLARSLAKRSAIRIGKKLTETEMRNIIDQLFACRMPNYTPDGNPTIMKMELNEFNSYFQNS
ncbi:DNA mismatch repair endonuclease MutL [Hyphobacterium sp. CCMP332]|nr:DNA mismatch repair endonuclease MutL [Hyphobacterium sp. CCMP332]